MRLRVERLGCFSGWLPLSATRKDDLSFSHTDQRSLEPMISPPKSTALSLSLSLSLSLCLRVEDWIFSIFFSRVILFAPKKHPK
ncbi:hypothetical protein LOK49_LG04G00741 [Camellia lanceoleosa]|uniref:Uncharacterized protein n=1 Tax=Camellia lanceoleosa TaxID=1840588 RepID=A0ACC0HYM5_9ERIC|nr:hypothetical protein LOK49_LG04G00741 [Camellia lanceoleosa]